VSKRMVHVARAGKIIGQYPPEQIAALVDSGFFLDTDFCYSETCPEWTPAPEFLKKIAVPKYLKVRESTGNSPDIGNTRRSRREMQNLTVLISGWIAFLLALSAVIAAAFWIAGLYGEMDRQSIRIDTLETAIAQKDKEIQRLLFTSREVAETGVVRGSVILRNESGKRAAMPGVQMSLFPRKAIEDHIERKAADVAKIPAGPSVDGNAFFTAELPEPIGRTTTDARGRFEFSLPEPGEYVIFTRMNISAQEGGQAERIWFVGFNSQDPLNSLVQVSEANCVQQFVPSLMVIDGR